MSSDAVPLSLRLDPEIRAMLRECSARTGIPERTLAQWAITGLFYAMHLLCLGWENAVEWVFRLFK